MDQTHMEIPGHLRSPLIYLERIVLCGESAVMTSVHRGAREPSCCLIPLDQNLNALQISIHLRRTTQLRPRLIHCLYIKPSCVSASDPVCGSETSRRRRAATLCSLLIVHCSSCHIHFVEEEALYPVLLDYIPAPPAAPLISPQRPHRSSAPMCKD